MTFGGPAAGASWLTKKDYEDWLILFMGQKHVEMADSFNPGETRQVAECELAIVFSKKVEVVEVHKRIRIDGNYVVPAITNSAIGVLGRLRKSVPPGGSRAGWWLEEPTEEEQEAAAKATAGKLAQVDGVWTWPEENDPKEAPF